jgi:uncharacterized membrane protein YfhO
MWKNKKTFYKYSLAYFFIIILVGIYFYSDNHSFVFADDAMQQDFVVVGYIRNYIRKFVMNLIDGRFILPAYDLSIGQGADIVTTLSYYGFINPIYWIVGVFPEEYLEEAYAFIYFFQLYLSGCSFLFLTKKLGIYENSHTWLATVLYICTTYSLVYCLMHPAFLTGMIYLPLMIAFARSTLLDFEGGRNLSLWTAVCIYANFYFGYVNIILVCVYSLVYYFSAGNKKQSIRGLVYIFLYILLGILLAAPTLVPNAIAVLNTYRSHSDCSISLFYSFKVYMDCIQRAFLLTSSGGSNETALGISGVCVASFLVMRKKNNQDVKTIMRLSTVMFIMIIFPVFGYILNGCSYSNNRWCYGFILMICLAIAFSDFSDLNKRSIYFLLIFACIVCIVIWVYRGTWSKRSTLLLIAEFTAGAIPGILYYQKRLSCICLNLVCVGLLCIKICMLFPAFTNAFVERGTLALTAEESISEENLVRITKTEQGNTPDINRTLLTGGYGISTYWSIVPENLTSYYLDFELCSLITPQTMSSFGVSLPLNTLAGVKYVVTKSENLNMYGFEKVSDCLYENTLALPLGYVYIDTIPNDYYTSLNPVEKMQALMQGIVLNGDIGVGTSESDNLVIDVEELSVDTIELVDVEQNDNVYTAEAGGTISVTYEAEEGYDIYLYVKNIKNIDGLTSARISLDVNGDNINSVLKSKDDVYYFERENILFPLGTTFEKGTHKYTLTLTFLDTVIFSMDSICVLDYSVSYYGECIASLQRNGTLTNAEFENDTLTGIIDSNDDGYLFLAIPYSEGWTAYIDGIMIDIQQANHLYMAVPISAGQHDIRFVYHIPGSKTGLILGSIGFIIFVFASIFGAKGSRSET